MIPSFTQRRPQKMPLKRHQAETAARHLVERVVLAHANDTVQQVLARLPGQTFDVLDAVYVVDEEQHLLGLIRLRELLPLPGDLRLCDVIHAHPPTTHLDEDQERLALLAIKHELAAVPVVDSEDRLLGVVPAQALLRILRREHMEDVHRLAGIHARQAQVQESFDASPVHRLRDRFPWLLVGLVGCMLATLVMAAFEELLQARIVVAFFVPAIVYLADAIGTQTEAISVRLLALNDVPLRRLLIGECSAGLLIGFCLAILVFPIILAGFGDLFLATAVSMSLLFASTVAAGVGLTLPWLLSRARLDPALGSGPLATVIQDVLSILIYFLMVHVFVA